MFCKKKEDFVGYVGQRAFMTFNVYKSKTIVYEKLLNKDQILLKIEKKGLDFNFNFFPSFHGLEKKVEESKLIFHSKHSEVIKFNI